MSSELGQGVNKVGEVDRGRRVETTSPTGQAVLNPVPSHDAPDVCH